MFALPRTGMCLRLSDDSARSSIGRASRLRCQQVHWLPLLHLGMPLGSTNGGMGFSRSEDTKVYSLRRQDRTTSAYGAQRTAAHPGREQTSSLRLALRRVPRTVCALEPATIYCRRRGIAFPIIPTTT